MLSTVAGAALLIGTGVLFAALLRLREVAAFCSAALVVAAAEIVSLTIVLSLVRELQVGWMLLGQALVAAGTTLAWLRADRPPLPASSWPSLPWVARSAREHPAAAGMCAVAIFALSVQLAIGLATAPGNWDSMTYHLARVAYWLQFDSALHWDNGTVRQLASPPNGEMLQGWTVLMSGSDRLAASVQWIAAVGLGALTFLGARDLGFARPPAVFAASLFVVLPQPILQASTTQNDLIVSFFLVAAVVFGLRGLRRSSMSELAIFALATGLAVGTKGTALFALPWIALIMLVAAWRARPSRSLVLRGVAVTTLAVVALGSFNYVLNQEATGSPVGDLRQLTERTSPLADNAVRSAWSLVDSPGVESRWFDIATERPALRLFGDLRTETFGGFTSDSTVDEDTSAYGLVGLVVLALFVAVALAPRTGWDRRALALTALAFLVTFFVLTEQHPWMGRLIMPGIALGAPLFAYLHTNGLTRGAAVGLALLTLVPSLLINEAKPLVAELGTPSILQRNRLEQITTPRSEMLPVLAALDELVPSDAPVGLVHDEDSWDYLLFGPELERRVVPLGAEDASYKRMREERVRGIVFLNSDPPANLDAQPLAEDGYWYAPQR